MYMPVRICEYCGKEFVRYIRPSWIPRGFGKYCSRECQHKAQITKIESICDFCNKVFLKQPSDIKKFNFCSRECKEKAQSLKGGTKFSGMRPGHYSKDTATINTYRDDALGFYGKFCSVCGYDDIRVLEVHHKDGNRKHNNIENLDVLCPTHHTEYQLGIRKYES